MTLASTGWLTPTWMNTFVVMYNEVLTSSSPGPCCRTVTLANTGWLVPSWTPLWLCSWHPIPHDHVAGPWLWETQAGLRPHEPLCGCVADFRFPMTCVAGPWLWQTRAGSRPHEPSSPAGYHAEDLWEVHPAQGLHRGDLLLGVVTQGRGHHRLQVQPCHTDREVSWAMPDVGTERKLYLTVSACMYVYVLCGHFVSPWSSHPGWLGIKKQDACNFVCGQIADLCVCVCVCACMCVCMHSCLGVCVRESFHVINRQTARRNTCSRYLAR